MGFQYQEVEDLIDFRKGPSFYLIWCGTKSSRDFVPRTADLHPQKLAGLALRLLLLWNSWGRLVASLRALENQELRWTTQRCVFRIRDTFKFTLVESIYTWKKEHVILRPKLYDRRNGLCRQFFNSIAINPGHKLYHLLPPRKQCSYNLRRQKLYNLPRSHTERFRHSFVYAMSQGCA